MFKKIKAWYRGLPDKKRDRIRFNLSCFAFSVHLLIYSILVAVVVGGFFDLDVNSAMCVFGAVWFIISFFPLDAVKFFNTPPWEHRSDKNK